MRGSVFLSGPEYKCGADGSKPCQNSLEISKGPNELTKISPPVTGTDQTRLVTPVQIRKNGTTTIRECFIIQIHKFLLNVISDLSILFRLKL